MSDINAAPSSTEPVPQTAPSDTALAAGGAENAVAIPQNAPLDTEVGTATTGESAANGSDSSMPISTSDSSATLSTSASTSSAADSAVSTSSATSTGESSSSASTLATSADTPAVAASGEPSAALGAAASTPANATGSVDASQSLTESGVALDGGDAGNVGASPAGGQSVSDTASSAQGASLGVGTVADALRSEIASLEQQLTDAHAEVAKWQGLYNAATEAKPHAQSLLQKLEAGEAIVLGDLQTKLRALVGAL
ncbi:hypothetical protein [Burkholderia thailandensis]|uniref:hypothetical protein n=1 Tax=Burkholderia thailandensis TaxID=57975 RepID=UPI0004F5DBD1|nr:hypothetical protein [Burkholderia thailandensis]AIP25949.1 hypothetical protein DR63_2691 [Burkholderia thailandensis E264]MCS6509928.1 hypothetical protein [Burkholderia thailandensis]NBC92912.1 hypothetical protein [Burkholderia thailandensis]NBD04339.1 hypothetical protein [Burkholderia thailandensis]NOK49962.1 hypothetical protein [Burkholderia thailandensis]